MVILIGRETLDILSKYRVLSSVNGASTVLTSTPAPSGDVTIIIVLVDWGAIRHAVKRVILEDRALGSKATVADFDYRFNVNATWTSPRAVVVDIIIPENETLSLDSKRVALPSGRNVDVVFRCHSK
jgi:hypothetical protein